MARRSAEGPSGRIALLGAASAAGAHLRAALAERGVPGERVELFGRRSDVAVLSEYDGEARLVQPAGELRASSCRAVFVCESGHDLRDVVEASRSGTLVVDLTGSVEGATLADAEAVRDGVRLVGVPHPIASLLGALLGPLHASLGVTRASAFVMRPAGDFGQPGLEELREQTIRLLRFETAPTEVFGRQLAFNVLPEHLVPGDESEASRRIVLETRGLVDAPAMPLTVTVALGSLFLGHAVALHVDAARGGRAEAEEALRAAAGVTVAGGDDAGALIDAPEDTGVLVARLDAPAQGSVRIWAVAAEAGSAPAARAVEAAAAAGVV